jgi:hypothetical protein
MGNLAWTVGDVSVTRLVEREVPLALWWLGRLVRGPDGVELRARA